MLPLRRRSPPRPSSPPPSEAAALPDEMIRKILHHLPADEPAWLLRASLVCKDWLGILTDPSFHHGSDRTPPMLGLLDDPHGRLRFTPTTASAFSLPTAVPDSINGDNWCLIDCRHGRALFLNRWKPLPVLQVWEPMTGNNWVVPAPATASYDNCVFLDPIAAVACAVDGCDHRCCQGGPFSLVIVFSRQDNHCTWTSKEVLVCKYSSSTCEWDEVMTSFDMDDSPSFTPSILIGQNLYFLLRHYYILEYNLDSKDATAFPIPSEHLTSNSGHITLVAGHDGELGILTVDDEDSSLLMLSMEEGDNDNNVVWSCCMVMELDKVLPQIHGFGDIKLYGYSQEVNTIIIRQGDDVFTIGLKSQRVKKVSQLTDDCPVFPLVTFYTPPGIADAPLGHPPDMDNEMLVGNPASELVDCHSGKLSDDVHINKPHDSSTENKKDQFVAPKFISSRRTRKMQERGRSSATPSEKCNGSVWQKGMEQEAPPVDNDVSINTETCSTENAKFMNPSRPSVKYFLRSSVSYEKNNELQADKATPSEKCNGSVWQKGMEQEAPPVDNDVSINTETCMTENAKLMKFSRPSVQYFLRSSVSYEKNNELQADKGNARKGSVADGVQVNGRTMFKRKRIRHKDVTHSHSSQTNSLSVNHKDGTGNHVATAENLSGRSRPSGRYLLRSSVFNESISL